MPSPPDYPQWPATLPPAALVSGSGYQPVSNATPIPVEAGELLTRRRFTGEMASMPVSLLLDDLQVQTLMYFYRRTLKETQPFMFYDPVQGFDVACVFTSPPAMTFAAPDRFQVSFTLMTKPVADEGSP